MAVEYINDLWASVERLVLSQYRHAEKLKAIISKNVNAYQGAENAARRLCAVLDIENAQGSWLDLIGGIKNVPRKANEGDTAYRTRLQAYLNKHNAGTPESVIEFARKQSGDENPIYFEEFPGVYFVYTPNGRQLMDTDYRKVSPAGVLGLPAAALKLADGRNLTFCNREYYIITDENEYPLTDDEGHPLVWDKKKASKVLCVARDENIGNIASVASFASSNDPQITDFPESDDEFG